MDLSHMLALFAGGLFAGTVNAVAGGSSFLIFPLLIASGLSPHVAAASGYVALTPANVVALFAYRRELAAIGPLLWPRVVFAFAGSIAGSLLFIRTGAAGFERIVPWLVLAATVLYAAGGTLRRVLANRGRDAAAGATGAWAVAAKALEFALYVYAGYFGAGVGIVLLALYALTGESDIHRANATKNATVLATSLLSLVLFTWNGLVAWPQAAAVGVGTIIGGYVSIALFRRINAVYLQRAILGWAIVLTAWMFYAYG
jgi:uncharacterized protein